MYGIFSYIYHKNQPNVGKYTSPMDAMGCITTNSHLVPSTSLKFKDGLLGASTHLRGKPRLTETGPKTITMVMDTTVSSRHGSPSSMLVSGGRGSLATSPNFHEVGNVPCANHITGTTGMAGDIGHEVQKIGAARRLYWSYSVRKYRGVVHVRD